MTQQINLFNPALLPRRELLSARNVALGALLSLLLVVAGTAAAGALLTNRQRQFDVADAELKTAQAQVTQLTRQAASQQPNAALQAQLDRARQLFDARQHVLTALGALGATQAEGGGFVDHLRGLARQSMSGLWLTQISLGAGGGDVRIKGRTIDRALVADYVERLNGEKRFAGLGFGGLRMSQGVEAVPAGGKPGSAAIPTTRPAPYIEFELGATPLVVPRPEGEERKS